MLCTMPGWRSWRYSFHTVTRTGVLMDAAPGPYSLYSRPSVRSALALVRGHSRREIGDGDLALSIVLVRWGAAVGEIRRARADRADLLALTGWDLLDHRPRARLSSSAPVANTSGGSADRCRRSGGSGRRPRAVPCGGRFRKSPRHGAVICASPVPNRSARSGAWHRLGVWTRIWQCGQ